MCITAGHGPNSLRPGVDVGCHRGTQGGVPDSQRPSGPIPIGDGRWLNCRSPLPGGFGFSDTSRGRAREKLNEH